MSGHSFSQRWLHRKIIQLQSLSS